MQRGKRADSLLVGFVSGILGGSDRFCEGCRALDNRTVRERRSDIPEGREADRVSLELGVGTSK